MSSRLVSRASARVTPLCAVGHPLVEAGHRVLFTPPYALVQERRAAKHAFDLPSALRKLDLVEALIIDDLGYVQQSPDEGEVSFTRLAGRYERRSTLLTSNLVFSQWDRIFKDQSPSRRGAPRAARATRACGASRRRDTFRGPRRDRALDDRV
jgi:DNA replication protein DnaC